MRAYQAAVSYTDHNLGAVLGKLRESAVLWRSTLVVFWGDHGFKLGHHGAWCKHTNFQEDTATPLLLRLPGVTDGKALVSDALVEHVDLMATLVDAAGLPPVPTCPADKPWGVARCTEGVSLVPLARAPSTAWKNASFSQYPRAHKGSWNGIMGYSMRLPAARFTAWVLFDSAKNTTAWRMDDERCGFELWEPRGSPPHSLHRSQCIHPVRSAPLRSVLRACRRYDLAADPLENVNLAYQKSEARRVQAHFEQLKAGWRATATELQPRVPRAPPARAPLVEEPPAEEVLGGDVGGEWIGMVEEG